MIKCPRKPREVCGIPEGAARGNSTNLPRAQNKYNQKGHSFDVRRSCRHRPAYTRERAAAMFLGSIV